MESAYEKRFDLKRLDTFTKTECEEKLMFLRYLYRREEDADLRKELRVSMDKLELKLAELKINEA